MTSCRCLRVDSSSAASIALKLAPSRLSSSVPVVSIRSDRSPVSVTFSVAPVKRRTGASAARETSRPSAAASAMPPRPMPTRIFRILLSEWLTPLRSCATWSAAGWPVSLVTGTVMTRKSRPDTLASLMNCFVLFPCATAKASFDTGMGDDARSSNVRYGFPCGPTS